MYKINGTANINAIRAAAEQGIEILKSPSLPPQTPPPRRKKKEQNVFFQKNSSTAITEGHL